MFTVLFQQTTTQLSTSYRGHAFRCTASGQQRDQGDVGNKTGGKMSAGNFEKAYVHRMDMKLYIYIYMQ